MINCKPDWFLTRTIHFFQNMSERGADQSHSECHNMSQLNAPAPEGPGRTHFGSSPEVWPETPRHGAVRRGDRRMSDGFPKALAVEGG